MAVTASRIVRGMKITIKLAVQAQSEREVEVDLHDEIEKAVRHYAGLRAWSKLSFKHKGEVKSIIKDLFCICVKKKPPGQIALSPPSWCVYH